jgi:hypothetical protein
MSTSKKLIEVINDAILTGTNGSSSIQEQSFISNLLENGHGKTFFTEKEEPCQSEKQASFVVTRWILRFIRIIVMVVLWLIHVVCYIFVPTKLFQERESDKKKTLNLLGIPSSPSINFSVIAVVFIIVIAFIVHAITFAIKDIMFPPLNMRANEQGVLTIDQPCLESHSFFLLNASTFWRSTGINVNEGDKVTFSVSGSMYSDIGEMDRMARENRKLLYPRARFAPNMERPTSEDAKYCIYNKFTDCFCTESQDARFGTLLCQVSDEHLPPSDPKRQPKDTIVQITASTNTFEANRSGTLFLTFNDVLLDKNNVYNMLTDSSISTRKMQKDLLDSNFFTFVEHDGDTNTSYKKIINEGKWMASLMDTIKQFYDTAHPDPTIWFKDNAGEYLVNIHIEKSIWKSDLSCSKKLAMSVMRKFEHCLRPDSGLRDYPGFWKSNVSKMFGTILLYFIIDLLVSYLVRSSHRTEDKKSPSDN